MVALHRTSARHPGAEGAKPKTSAKMILEPTDRGWFYSAPVPGSRTVTCFLTDADLVPAGRIARRVFFDGELANCRYVANPDGRYTERVVSVRPGRLNSFCGEGWFAVGDAAATLDPLSSHGLVNALHSGCLAASLVATASTRQAQEEFTWWWTSVWERYRVYHRVCYGVQKSWGGSAFWARRADALFAD